MSETHYRTCNLCEAMCGLKITHLNGKIEKIEGDKEDPLSRGHLCPKAYGLKDIYEDPDRLKRPLKKINGNWQEISWELAYEEVASKIIEMNMKYGADSIAVYQGNPSIHNLGTMLTSQPFFRSLKTKNMYTATSTDQLPHHFASWLMYGHPLLVPIPDIDNTDLWVIFGGNPLVSNGSMMSVPDVAHRMKAIQERGGKIIVIDPRKTETALKADQHIFIKPGKDAWLLAAIANYIISEGKLKWGSLADFTDGLDELTAAIKYVSIAKASIETGVREDVILALAETICQAEKAAIYGRVGVSTQSFGGLSHWLINVLNILTGNLDKVGGVLFTTPAIDSIGRSKPRNRFNRWQSRVRKFPEFIGELPVACLSEEIETDGPGQIKMLMTSCGNPVLSITNGGRLDKALEKLEYMVSIDIYMNETSRHADIILPPATGVETSHYDLTFHHLAIRNSSKYSPALFEKTEGARYDWEIFQELGNVLSRKVSGEEINGGKIFTPEQMLSRSMAANTYCITWEQVMESPHGLDLGALKPQLPGRLSHENKRINLAPELLLNDLNRLQASANKSGEGYLLIGKRHLRDNNSWMHNSEQLQKGKNRCILLINPKDAKKEGLADKEVVRVKSRVGEVKINVEISDEMMPGVLAMPHGYGHNKKGIKMEVAQKNAGVSVNDLTDDLVIDELTGNSAFSNVYVTLHKNSEQAIF